MKGKQLHILNKLSILVTAVVLLMIMSGLGSPIYSQSMSQSSRSLGMGGTGSAYISGYQANTVNPANLLLSDGNPQVSFGLLGGLTISGGGSLLNTNVYEQYLTQGKTLTGSVASDMLSQWYGSAPGDMNFVGLGVDITTFAMGVRLDRWGFGVSARTRVEGRIDVGRGITELGIYGLDGSFFSEGRSVNFGVKSNVYTELSGAISRELFTFDQFLAFRNIRVLMGVAPKVIIGTQGSSLDFNSDLSIKGDSLIHHDFEYTFKTTGSIASELKEYATARENDNLNGRSLSDFVNTPDETAISTIGGVGYGLDAGVTVEMDISTMGIDFLDRADRKKLRLSLALTDFGQVIYDEQVGKFEAAGTLNWEGLEVDDQELDEEYDGDYKEYANYVLVDSLLEGKYADFQSVDISSVSYPLPTRASFGAQLQLDRFSLATDVGMGFNRVGMNTLNPMVAIGSEYKFFGFLPLRIGTRIGGNMATRYSFGTGLDFKNVTFDLSVMSSLYGAKKGAGATVAWSGLQFRF